MNPFGSTKLFNGITPDDLESMLVCLNPTVKTFSAGETVCSGDDLSSNMCIIHGGSANIIRIDEDGSRAILERLVSGSVFGGALAFSSSINDCVEIICEKSCKIMFIECKELTKRCAKACEFHSRLVENMLSLASERTLQLSRRVEILSRRSIRSKLLAFFESEAKRFQSRSFTLEFTYSDLADFLCVDRCAMMRELKKLKTEQIISCKGKALTIN